MDYTVGFYEDPFVWVINYDDGDDAIRMAADPNACAARIRAFAPPEVADRCKDGPWLHQIIITHNCEEVRKIEAAEIGEATDEHVLGRQCWSPPGTAHEFIADIMHLVAVTWCGAYPSVRGGEGGVWRCECKMDSLNSIVMKMFPEVAIANAVKAAANAGASAYVVQIAVDGRVVHELTAADLRPDVLTAAHEMIIHANLNKLTFDELRLALCRLVQKGWFPQSLLEAVQPLGELIMTNAAICDFVEQMANEHTRMGPIDPCCEIDLVPIVMPLLQSTQMRARMDNQAAAATATREATATRAAATAATTTITCVTGAPTRASAAMMAAVATLKNLGQVRVSVRPNRIVVSTAAQVAYVLTKQGAVERIFGEAGHSVNGSIELVCGSEVVAMLELL